MERLARGVIRHRRIVTAVWLVLFLAGGWSAGQLSDRLTLDFSLPGQPGDTAERALVENYGVSSFDTYVAHPLGAAGGRWPSGRVRSHQVFAAAAQAVPGLRLNRRGHLRSGRLRRSRRAYGYCAHPGTPARVLRPGVETQVAPALAAAAGEAGLESGLTSYGLLSAGGETEGPSVLVETLFGALGALLVLLFVFASFLALVPLLIAAVSILTTFLLVLGPHHVQRRELRGAVPHLADRARCRHRLLAAGGVALA